MKIKYTVIVGIALATMFFNLTGCNRHEQIREAEQSIYESWTIVKFEPGFSPIESYDEGVISWNFLESGVLNVALDNSVALSPIVSEGQHEFSVNGNQIQIDNSTYDFLLSNDNLIISDDPSADGFRATFLIFDIQ